MDPDVTLDALRALMRKLSGDAACGVEIDPTDVADAWDLFSALDEWLSRGGFLPAEWLTDNRP